MSKIGRKPIDVAGLQVTINGNTIQYAGSKASGTYVLPNNLKAEVKDTTLALFPFDSDKKNDRGVKAAWGLHRALLANILNGARKSFVTEVQINGLGFKAVPSGKSLVMSLGYSHKIDFALPADIAVTVDKTGQKLTFESVDKTSLGAAVSSFRNLRPPEVYKGTGIKRAAEVLIRKASKKKA